MTSAPFLKAVLRSRSSSSIRFLLFSMHFFQMQISREKKISLTQNDKILVYFFWPLLLMQKRRDCSYVTIIIIIITANAIIMATTNEFKHMQQSVIVKSFKATRRLLHKIRISFLLC